VAKKRRPTMSRMTPKRWGAGTVGKLTKVSTPADTVEFVHVILEPTQSSSRPVEDLGEWRVTRTYWRELWEQVKAVEVGDVVEVRGGL
jgi:hypothetical protein